MSYFSAPISSSSPGVLGLPNMLLGSGSSSKVWYVSSTGTDAVAPRGLTQKYPLLTVAQAISNASDGDIIAVMNSSTITGGLATSKRLILTGIGTSNGQPSVSLIFPSNDYDRVSSAWMRYQNLTFKCSAASTSNILLFQALTAGSFFEDCRFEMGANVTVAALAASGTSWYSRFKRCTFISTATGAIPAIDLSGAGTSHCYMEDCILDGSSDGFSGDGAAVDAGSSDIWSIGTSMLRGAGFTGLDFGAIAYPTSTGGSQVYTADGSVYMDDGIGATYGPRILNESPVVVTATPNSPPLLFVSSVTGDDTNAGDDRQQPLATLATAVGSAATGTIIVLMNGHDETVTSAISIPTGTWVVGELGSSGDPGATLRPGSATAHVVTLDNANAAIIGVAFAAPTSATTGTHIYITGKFCRVQQCTFAVNGYSNNANASCIWESSTGTYCIVETCSFTSATLDTDDIPKPAVSVDTGYWDIIDCTFSGQFSNGTYQCALDLSGAGNTMYVTGLNLLDGADVLVGPNFEGLISVASSDGTAQVRQTGAV